jgi:uncharacterized repeat protein (TIGR01451 family)
VTGGNSEGDRNIRAEIPTILPEESVILRYRVLVKADTPEGTWIDNQGSVSAKDIPTIPTDSLYTLVPDDPTVIGPVAEEPAHPPAEDPADGVIPETGNGLEVFKRIWDFNGGSIEPGDIVEYAVFIVNYGENPTEGIVFQDAPAGYISLIPGSVTSSQGKVTSGNIFVFSPMPPHPEVGVDAGSIGAGQTAEIRFLVYVDERTPEGTAVRNQGMVLPDIPSDDPFTVKENDPTVFVVTGPPAIYDPPSVYKTVSGGRPVIRWNQQWINDSNADALLVHVEDNIPDGAVYIEGSLNADYGKYWYEAETERIFWEGDIPGNGGEVNIWFDTRVDENIQRLENQACGMWDVNGSGAWEDERDSLLSAVCSNPAVWQAGCELRLGNRVWEDADKDGMLDISKEKTFNEVKVNLYRDTDRDNRYTPGTDEFLQTTVTYSHEGIPGYYEFDHLCDDDYIVQIDPENFAEGKILQGYETTTGESDPDDDIDHDDNGILTDGFGVLSLAVSLRSGTEPLHDDDDEDETVYRDADSNFTVDFGFILPENKPEPPVCDMQIAFRVWEDKDQNAVWSDTADMLLKDVKISLYADTDNNGIYTPGTDQFLADRNSKGISADNVFTDLCEGVYILRVEPENPTLTGYESLHGDSREKLLILRTENAFADFGFRRIPEEECKDCITPIKPF